MAATAPTIRIPARTDAAPSARPTGRAAWRDGYVAASAVERASFGMLGAFSLTIATTRAVNWRRERLRRAPALRSLIRRAHHAPDRGGLRVHHFVPGIGIAFAAAVAAIAGRDDGREAWLGPAFGVGAGLTADELALLVELDNPYWSKQALPAAEAALGALGALVLGVRFALAGRGN